MMTLTDEELRAARLARARRWLAAGHDLRGYPTLADEDENEETLAASPPEKLDKKPKPPAAAQ
jgi:hypothetical protein